MIPLSDNLSCKGKARFTLWLIIANLLWFIAELKVMGLHIALSFFGHTFKLDIAGTGSEQQFFGLFAMTPDAVTAAIHSGNFYQLIMAVMSIFSSMFVHAGLAHIAGNMLMLWVFGQAVEARLGGRRFLLFYLLGGLAAAALQLFMDPTSLQWFMGASGAVAAVLAGYVVFWPRAKLGGIIISWGPQWAENVSASLYIFYWIVAQFTGILESLGQVVPAGIAYWEHVGGFGFGLLAAFLWKWYRPKSDVCEVIKPCVCGRLPAPDDFFELGQLKNQVALSGCSSCQQQQELADNEDDGNCCH